jgi:hypothetical protein
MLMSYDGLKREFEKKVLQLQMMCKHNKTEWMDSYWAPGHGGKKILLCKRCHKTLEEK